MVYSYLALSVIFSFFSQSFLGLLSGGMVSAGYLAFYLFSPTRLISTICVSFVILGLIKVLKHWTILFGRRRFMASIVLSIIITYGLEKFLFSSSLLTLDLRVVGLIVPGLIASDMEKGGVGRTLLSLFSSTLLIALILMAFGGGL